MSVDLTKTEFDILVALTEQNEPASQRMISELTSYSVSTVSRVLKKLIEYGYVQDGSITKKGIVALEPYRAKRAIFIAAGFGSRMVPITLNTPKPMVRVRGKRIIDGLIDACLQADIKEIYIVRGYLAEQFDVLLNKYPMIHFLENPMYNEANNISSAMIVRKMLQNAYVMEADLLVTNPDIIRKYNYQSNVRGIWMERTDDWCFEEKNGYIVDQKIGGRNCYQMVGIFYWNAEDGKRLEKQIVETYRQPGGKERYWETVATQLHKDEYKIELIPCQEEDVVEIDTFRELKAIDPVYDI